MNNKKYEIHEFAGLVPMASQSEQSSLNTDILKNGLHDPIVLWRGKIVDGRCRQIACLLAGEKIRTKELDDSLTEDAVKSFVKSVNTRRNLTQTQKIMSACKQSLDPSEKSSMDVIAHSWGISRAILANAKYISKERPEFIDSLFNGKSVKILNADNEEIESNKITAVYAYIKRYEEQHIAENNDHAWHENTYIKTQKGKEWYYDEVKELKLKHKDVKVKMRLAELANYKFEDYSDLLTAIEKIPEIKG